MICKGEVMSLKVFLETTDVLRILNRLVLENSICQLEKYIRNNEINSSTTQFSTVNTDTFPFRTINKW